MTRKNRRSEDSKKHVHTPVSIDLNNLSLNIRVMYVQIHSNTLKYKVQTVFKLQFLSACFTNGKLLKPLGLASTVSQDKFHFSLLKTLLLL